LRGRKRGRFIRREFEFHACQDCGLLFVEPFTGFAIYNDAYYRGEGPDPYVDYETEYRDWRRSDRGLEFEDVFRLAEKHVQTGAGSTEQGAGTESTPSTSDLRASRSPNALAPSPFSLLPAPGAQRSLRWLDFGCGAGGFLKFLRERGQIGGRALEVEGHDVGSYAELLKRADGFRILDFNELSREPDARYDVISMIEVIEHLPEPRVALALVARLLKPGGLLLLTTGNLDNPVARRQGIHYRYCAPEIHVSLFNPQCLARLYRSVGLEPVAVRYHGAVKFKVVKSLRHHPVLRAMTRVALQFPPVVWAVDWLYGVSAMPCAVKRS
jgi:2-polyprenyl-3-methyl-5-hydroxy-6-metoxy-1,4-benzoquinol methylase